MKRTVKSVLSLLMVACLICVAVLPAFAELANSTVTYDGDAKKFIFAPGSDESPTDLFTNFKEVMPGDTIDQEILIKNDASNKVKVDIYLRSLGKAEDDADFLKYLTLSVQTLSGDELYDGPADQAGDLSEWTSLGTFYSGAETQLLVTLHVPSDLDSKYSDAAAAIDWQFRVDEFPIEEDDPVPTPAPEPVPTGDNSGLVLWISIAGISVCGVIVLLLLLHRNKKKN